MTYTGTVFVLLNCEAASRRYWTCNQSKRGTGREGYGADWVVKREGYWQVKTDEVERTREWKVRKREREDCMMTLIPAEFGFISNTHKSKLLRADSMCCSIMFNHFPITEAKTLILCREWVTCLKHQHLVTWWCRFCVSVLVLDSSWSIAQLWVPKGIIGIMKALLNGRHRNRKGVK